MKLAAGALAVLLFAGPATAAPHCTPYHQPVVLTGTVDRMMFYGPPNFGEDPRHDQRAYYPVFRPDRAPHMCRVALDFNIPPGADIPRRMQMIFYPIDPRRWYGRHVTVTAKLWPWETASHHTPIMLDVVEIRRADGG